MRSTSTVHVCGGDVWRIHISVAGLFEDCSRTSVTWTWMMRVRACLQSAVLHLHLYVDGLLMWIGPRAAREQTRLVCQSAARPSHSPALYCMDCGAATTRRPLLSLFAATCRICGWPWRGEILQPPPRRVIIFFLFSAGPRRLLSTPPMVPLHSIPVFSGRSC